MLLADSTTWTTWTTHRPGGGRCPVPAPACRPAVRRSHLAARPCHGAAAPGEARRRWPGAHLPRRDRRPPGGAPGLLRPADGAACAPVRQLRRDRSAPGRLVRARMDRLGGLLDRPRPGDRRDRQGRAAPARPVGRRDRRPARRGQPAGLGPTRSRQLGLVGHRRPDPPATRVSRCRPHRPAAIGAPVGHRHASRSAWAGSWRGGHRGAHSRGAGCRPAVRDARRVRRQHRRPADVRAPGVRAWTRDSAPGCSIRRSLCQAADIRS